MFIIVSNSLWRRLDTIAFRLGTLSVLNVSDLNMLRKYHMLDNDIDLWNILSLSLDWTWIVWFISYWITVKGLNAWDGKSWACWTFLLVENLISHSLFFLPIRPKGKREWRQLAKLMYLKKHSWPYLNLKRKCCDQFTYLCVLCMRQNY